MSTVSLSLQVWHVSTGDLVSQINNTRECKYPDDRNHCAFFNDSVRVVSAKIDGHVMVREYTDNIVCSMPWRTWYTAKILGKTFLCVETPACSQEQWNTHDKFAVTEWLLKRTVITVIKNSPKEVAHICLLFLKRGGSIEFMSAETMSLLNVYALITEI